MIKPNEDERLTLAEIAEAIAFYESRIADGDLAETERTILRADIAMFIEMRRELEREKPAALTAPAQ